MAPLAQLLRHHVIVDLETTGLDPSRDEVIELGAVFVHDGEIVDRVQRLFAPSQPLPLAIRRITGITDEELRGAPPFSAFLPELKEKLAGWTVVAHNASFEQSFLSQVLEELRAPVLDSCELLHYLYPELESHSLEAVIRWAAAGTKAAHRALQDCEDTLSVLRFALERTLKDGRTEELEELLAVLDPSPDEPPGTALIALLRTLRDEAKSVRLELTLQPSSPFLPARMERLRASATAREEREEKVRITSEQVDAVLGPGGALERDGVFQSRTQQREMAQAVASALNDGGVLAVEAGTGTGKSLGYLAPAALYAIANGEKVAVATHTRTLQDQLVEKDLPRLHRALGGSFGFAVLKGQTNYLCRRRTLELTAPEPGFGHEERAPRAYLRALLRRSPDGDLDRVSYWFKEHFPALIPLLLAARSEAATTLGEKCPHFRRCYYHSAVAHAKEADVLVVNQALAFSWPSRYPKLDHLILDEAHEVEDAATSALAVELSHVAFLQLGERFLGREGRRGVIGELKRSLAGLGLGRAVTDLTREVEGRMEQLLLDARSLGDDVSALIDHVGGGEDRGYLRECRITAEVHAVKAWNRVHHSLLTLVQDFEEIEKALRPKVLELAPDLPVRRPELDKELSGAEDVLRELSAAVAEFAEPPRQGRCQFATARRLPSGRVDWQLVAQPTDVSSFFSTGFAEQRKTLILTSATLSTGPESPWVLDRLGLNRMEERKPRFLSAPTPFDLKKQTLVVLVTDAPDPQSAEFVEWASARISGLAQYMGGRVLGLFASTRRLEDVGQRVRAALEPSGIEVLRQSRGNGRALAARQEQDFGSVLLGTKSFWQGLDIPGRGLSCVFIDKLPLEPQSRPIVAAREEVFGGDGGSFQGFMRYRLPRALIQLRQGVGRLIRSTSDRGVVIIADPGSPAYRKHVLAALAGYRVEVLPWSRARVRIFEALNEMNLAAPSAKRTPVEKAANAS